MRSYEAATWNDNYAFQSHVPSCDQDHCQTGSEMCTIFMPNTSTWNVTVQPSHSTN
ncbi:hypothetical protein DPMN_133745 [Dreissena polymorpha]|uniref:Uncharacterized protein n=1 Tax=Dreissena polymorpha TaxID=45954 RepID=A0A9D4G0Q5_DREPO|nr:hypothetical protein DPMN_133745 [Dreissena polymorpha]